MEKTRMTIRIAYGLNKWLERVAEETGRSKNDLIVSACWDFLKDFSPNCEGGADDERR